MRLVLTDEHWQIIRYLREYFEEHGVQTQVREMIRHFRRILGEDKGNNRRSKLRP